MILGGAGFIGKNLSRYLSGLGYDVTCMDRLVNQEQCDSVKYIQGDFLDSNMLKKAIEGMDYVIHAISTLNPGNSNELYMQGYEKDFIQTVRLCEMLVGTDTKLIFISSGGTVYGVHKHQPIAENVLPRPINHYGNIKLCIESTLRAFNYQMYNKMLIVRISNPYGPGQDFTKGVGFIDAALKRTLNGQPIEIWGDGKNVRDYIYIQDVCYMIGVLLNYQGKFDTFNISSGVGFSQNEVIQILKNQGLAPKVIYRNKRSVDIRKIVLNNQRICSLCERNPLPLEKGIQIYLEYLEREREIVRD